MPILFKMKPALHYATHIVYSLTNKKLTKIPNNIDNLGLAKESTTKVHGVTIDKN